MVLLGHRHGGLLLFGVLNIHRARTSGPRVLDWQTDAKGATDLGALYAEVVIKLPIGGADEDCFFMGYPQGFAGHHVYRQICIGHGFGSSSTPSRSDQSNRAAY